MGYLIIQAFALGYVVNCVVMQIAAAGLLATTSHVEPGFIRQLNYRGRMAGLCAVAFWLAS